jgi:hypothetical protein
MATSSGRWATTKLGLEVLGHSWDDRTRYSAAIVKLKRRHGTGLALWQRVHWILYFQSSFRYRKTGRPAPRLLRHDRRSAHHLRSPVAGRTDTFAGSGIGNKKFQPRRFCTANSTSASTSIVTGRDPARFEDSAWFGQGYGDVIDGVSTVNNNVTGTTLPGGSRNPTWNGVLFEPHYVYSPQLIFIGRFETIRMSQQSGRSDESFEPGQYHHLHRRLPLQPVHDQPRWLRLA